MTAIPITRRCDACGATRDRDDLMVKRIQFRQMGLRGKVVKTRTVAWLCRTSPEPGAKPCVERDPAWAREPWVDAPGTAAKTAASTED